MKINYKLISFSTFFILTGLFIPISSFEKNNIKIESNSLISNLNDKKEIKTVIVNGFGTNIKSATQNAAENALTQVVGSFIDAETQINSQKEIRDGIVNITKTIKKDKRDYSQGSIKYFEILNVKQNGSIFNVTARVDVLVEDLKSYIKNLSSTNKKVREGLFADAIVSEENENNKLKILHSKLLEISKGEVLDTQIGSIKLLKNFEKPLKFRKYIWIEQEYYTGFSI